MSKMLEQAIIDAEALKEAAIKNAEATIIEKYSDDIKNVVDQLLEQAPPAMGGAPPPAMGGMDPAMMAMAGGPAPGPENMGDIPGAHEMQAESTVIVDLGQLKNELELAEDLDPKNIETHALVAEEVAGTGVESGPREKEETFVIEESLIADILNEVLDTTPPMTIGGDEPELDFDDEPELDFGDLEGEDIEIPDIEIPETPTTPPTVTENYDEEYDLDEDYELEEETEETEETEALQEHIGTLEQNMIYYHKQYKKLYEAYTKKSNETNNVVQVSGKLKEQNDKLRDLLVRTQDKLNEINVQNAKLHYTNRILNSVSLNERQKDKIVEAIQKTGTVEETKTIFETLQSAVAGIRDLRKSPKSLNEAINKNSSAFLPRPREDSQSDPKLKDRLQILAGIK